MRTVQNMLDTKDQTENNIDPNTMVIDALKKLISVNLSYLIVYENDEYVGIFSERDYTRKLVLEGRSSRDTKVKDVLTRDLPKVEPQTTVEDCMYLMNSRGSRYLAAYEDNKFIGIITIHDLLREALASKEDVFNGASSQLLNTHESGKFF